MGNKNEQSLLKMRKSILRKFDSTGVDALIDVLIDLYRENEVQSERLSRLELNLKALNIDVVNDYLVENLFASEVDLDASSMFSTDTGLLALEYTESDIPFRWTGGNGTDVLFRLFVDRTKKRSLIISFMKAGPLQDWDSVNLDCFVDGKPLKFEAYEDDHIINFSTVLPKCEVNAPTKVQLYIPIWTPEDIDSESTDTRQLGYAFTSLAIK